MMRALVTLAVFSLFGCANAPLGAGILVHPEIDPGGVGVVKYRVGGYDTARDQMVNACAWGDVQIVKHEIEEPARVTEGTAFATKTAAGAVSSDALVTSTVVYFQCVDRTESSRRYAIVIPPKQAEPTTKPTN